MRWKTPIPEVSPSEGQKRTRLIFALLPHECDDGMTRWLETIRVFEKFTYHYGGMSPSDCVEGGYSWDAIGYAAKEPEKKTPDFNLDYV